MDGGMEIGWIVDGVVVEVEVGTMAMWGLADAVVSAKRDFG
jgi:hypothetical protein